jgi:hypothetical protein
MPDGDYLWTIGLYDTRERLSLEGKNDGENRIILGTLHVANGALRFAPESLTPRPLDRPDEIVISDPVKTDGCVYIYRAGKQWELRPFPREAGFTILLNTRQFPVPHKITAGSNTVKPINIGNWWKLPLTGSDEYRWNSQ